MKLTTQQRQIIDGLMLGDGNLSLRGPNQNPRLRINRSSKDKQYAEWIDCKLPQLSTPKALHESEVFDERYNKAYGRIAYSSKQSELLKPVHQRWYDCKGKKRVPHDLKLPPLTLAVWFADDGSFYERSSGGYEITFATQGFTPKEVEFLLEKLCEISPHFRKCGNYKGRNQYKIIGNIKAARPFFRKIDSCFPPLPRKSTIWRNEVDINIKPIPCPECFSEETFRNGFYYGRTGVKQAQRMSCKTCNYKWKRKVKASPTNQAL